MKKNSSLLHLLFATTGANIIFPYVQPTCDYSSGSETCLRGQVCIRNNPCVAVATVERREECVMPQRSDGRCSRDFDGACCDSNGPYRPCCSQRGWCGKTPEHCLASDGCQSGCTPTADLPEHSSSTPLSDSIGLSSSAAPLSEPILGRPTQTASGPTASGSVTMDGMCGAAYGGTVCGNWLRGSCCSM